MIEGEGSRQVQGKAGQRITFPFYKHFSIFFSEIDRITNSVKKIGVSSHFFTKSEFFIFGKDGVFCRYHLINFRIRNDQRM
jgi:hypothetical protein